jgi:hypothetical protein
MQLHPKKSQRFSFPLRPRSGRRVTRSFRLIKLVEREIVQNRALGYPRQRTIQRWQDWNQDGRIVKVRPVRCPCIRVTREIHAACLGLSAVGIPVKNRSTLCLVGLSCNMREGDMVLRLTYSIVKRGETTVPYCAAFAPLGSAPFVLGEIVSVQMLHQHRIL